MPQDEETPISAEQEEENKKAAAKAKARYRSIAAGLISGAEAYDQGQKAVTGTGDVDWAEYNPGMMGG